MFSTAEVELEAFGSFNQPDLFYEFYPDTYPGRKGRYILIKLFFSTVFLFLMLSSEVALKFKSVNEI